MQDTPSLTKSGSLTSFPLRRSTSSKQPGTIDGRLIKDLLHVVAVGVLIPLVAPVLSSANAPAPFFR